MRAEVGIGAKALARIVRFTSAQVLVHQRLVSDQRAPTLAQIAARCGYANETHLIHDWSAFNGTTPMAWRARDEFAFHRAH